MRTRKLKLLGLSRACDNNEHMLTADPDESIFTDKELLSIDLELLK